MESIAAELASTFIESSLGFDSEETKLLSLQKIRQSLEESCRNYNDNNNDSTTAAAAAQSWIDLMEGTHEENILLRDTFIKSILETIIGNNNDYFSSDDEIVFDLMESAFDCLASLIRLRCDNNDSSGS